MTWNISANLKHFIHPKLGVIFNNSVNNILSEVFCIIIRKNNTEITTRL